MKVKLFFLLVMLSLPCFAQSDKNHTGLGLTVVTNKDKVLRESSISYTVVDTLPSASSWIGELAFEGDFIWSGHSDLYLYKTSSVDGSVIRRIPTTYGTVDGLAFDGQYLWVGGTGTTLNSPLDRAIQKVDPQTGNVVSSFTYSTNSDYTHSIAVIDNQLWVNMYYYSPVKADSTFVFDMSGTVQAKYASGCHIVHGITSDGNNLWLTGNQEAYPPTWGYIYKYSKEPFEKLDSLPIPGGVYPNGIDYHGGYLWMAEAGSDKIYKIDVGLPTAIKDADSENKVSIYPNPFHDRLFIKNNTDGAPLILEILDEQGARLVNLSIVQDTSIDLGDLKSGIYFYNVKNDSKVIQQGKLIRN